VREEVAFIDLKSGILDGHTAAMLLMKGMADEFRENDLLSVDGFCYPHTNSAAVPSVTTAITRSRASPAGINI
jgi:hypothetical protein